MALLGSARSTVSTGFAIGGRVGYDLLRWLAVQAHFVGSTHTATLEGMPQAAELIQIYCSELELKLSHSFRQIGILAFGGVGAAHFSSNLLGTVGLSKFRNSFAAGGGAALDYHTLSRHFSIGLQGSFYVLTNVHKTEALAVTTYLRYTF